MDSSIQKEFGEGVRAMRASTGLSQERFALKIGMDRTYYSSVEMGHRNISLVNIDRIAKGLGITISQLFSSIENNIGGQHDRLP